MIRPMVYAVAFLLFQTGCSNAASPDFDSNNPVHCMAIFGVAANGAKQVSQPAVVDEMVRRISFIAAQHGGPEWIKKITPEAQEAGRKMEAARDERATIKLYDDCLAAQDANPRFRAR